MFEHRDQNSEPPINDGAQRTPVRVSRVTEALVKRATRGVPSEAVAPPVVGGLAQPLVAGMAHLDEPVAFATPLGHWCDPGVGPQRVIITIGQRPGRFG